MNVPDAFSFGWSISGLEAQIADLRRDVSVPDLAVEGRLPLSCKPGIGFSSCISSCLLKWLQVE
jgi:hypothetical protein